MRVVAPRPRRSHPSSSKWSSFRLDAGRMIPAVFLAFLMTYVDVSYAVRSKKIGSIDPPQFELNIHMPGWRPTQNDDYVCTKVEVDRSGYVVGYRPTAHADRVHHMILHICDEPGDMTVPVWSCMHMNPVCRGGKQKILYAWARNAPPFHVPDNVGFPVGPDVPGGIRYLVLQVHYANQFDGEVVDYSGVTLDTVPETPEFIAGVYLFAGGGTIPPHLPVFNMNMTCVYDRAAILHPFAFRTHTHHLGRVVSAGIKRDGKWELIGKRNPQWPQMFQHIPESQGTFIKPGDSLSAQCRYDSTSRKSFTMTGAHGNDEMCNFYMMFYRRSTDPDPFPHGGGCYFEGMDFNQAPAYPPSFSALLPPRPELEEHSRQSSLPFESSNELRPREVAEAPEGSGMPDHGSGFLVDSDSREMWKDGDGTVWRNKGRKRRRSRRQAAYGGVGGMDDEDGFIPSRRRGGGGMGDDYGMGVGDVGVGAGYGVGDGYYAQSAYQQRPSGSSAARRRGESGHTQKLMESAGIDPVAENNDNVETGSTADGGRVHAVDNVQGGKAAEEKMADKNAGKKKVITAPGAKKRVKEVGKWTKISSRQNFGQIGGLSMDNDGHLVVFHRGNVIWGSGTFDLRNRLTKRTLVNVDAVVTLNSKTGKVISSWGKNRFYMPHGVTVDHEKNVWLTDVGMHQVFKYVKDGSRMKIQRSWGEAFVPGNDNSHFCKPTAVAVSKKDGSFFVADGYCNARILHFDAQGNFLHKFGQMTTDVNPGLGSFLLPHDIVILDNLDRIHVADRQNGRVQMLYTNGTGIGELRPPEEYTTVYATDYCSHDGYSFLLPGEKPKMSPDDIKVFAVSDSTKRLAYSFTPSSQSFSRPHILRASKDCKSVFVGEIDGTGGVIWKFNVERDSEAMSQRSGSATGKATIVQKTKPYSSSSSKSSSSDQKTKQEEEGGGSDGSSSSANEGGSEGVGGRSTGKMLALGGVLIAVTICIVYVLCRRCKGGNLKRAMDLQSVSHGYFSDNKFGAFNRSHKSKIDTRKSNNSFTHKYPMDKGFQPLRTEDVDAIDDLTDESDGDDTLYPTFQKPKGPMSA